MSREGDISWSSIDEGDMLYGHTYTLQLWSLVVSSPTSDPAEKFKKRLWCSAGVSLEMKNGWFYVSLNIPVTIGV